MRTRCVIAGAAALVLLGTGAPALAADDSGPDLNPFYRQRVTWGDCEGLDQAPAGMRCAKVSVPLDYAAPRKGTLELALNRIPATGEKRGSLLVNFGGPGGPGVSGLAGMAKQFGDLTKSYDVVGFDPRGVGTSAPVTCGDGSDMPDEPLADDPGAVLEHAARQWKVCRKHAGPVADHIGTVNVSRDMDVMRAALGDDKLNFLGFSYGTRLGAVYTGQFPHKVGRMVLDGVDTLAEPMAEQQRVAVEGQQTALDNFATWCSRNVGCVLGSNSRDAKQSVTELVEQLDERPVELGGGMEYSGADLVTTLGSALYHRDAWPYLSQAIANLVTDRDPRALLRIGGVTVPPPGEGIPPDQGAPADGTALTGVLAARAGDDVVGKVVPQEDVPVDNFGVALAMVNCADDPDRLTAAQLSDEAEIQRLVDDYTEASPIFGPARLEQVLLCAGQPRGTDFIRKIRNVDTPRFLLVGTRGDPATPYRWAVETTRRLGDQAVLLDNQGDGHTGYFSSRCVTQKVNDYLLYGELGAGPLYCGDE
ncbi:alpha/beta hydrolase [Streptomyces boluensis]|uniref:Alpha/beta fold hydrolase n=1 Tax=Streptomyces boluensis TaxID=1775135 RepID=A0A964UT38_9ACTN|nr:alpha/beta hydrolase [Streptomyces boluensis]NBE54929.1 alpha/beta fold hydrolase [Streptomyces boluensis]